MYVYTYYMAHVGKQCTWLHEVLNDMCRRTQVAYTNLESRMLGFLCT